MNYRTIIFEKRANICVITLNRPSALNAIDSLMSGELIDVLERVEGDDDLYAAVVIGAGNRAFSVGMDMKELVDATHGVEHIPTLLEIRRRTWRYNPWERLANLSKPTIAAISGLALGGGLELALACDIRVAGDNAKCGFPEVGLGILPARGGTQRLPRIIGRAKALEMILAGATIDASDAFRSGLVSKIVPANDLLNAAVEIATRVANNAPIAVRFAREAVAKGMDMTLDQGLRMETDLYVLLQTTDDRNEGIRSFLEKRKPTFRGS